MTTKTEASASPDVLSRALPAASATSDMPGAAEQTTVAAPPTSAAGTATEVKAEPQKTEAKSGEGGDKTPVEGDGKTAAGAEGEKKPEGEGGKKVKTGISERFSEVTAQRKAADEKAANAETARIAAEARADKLSKDLETALEAINKVVPPAPEDVRPTRAQFDDPDKYDEALATWAHRAGEKKAKAEAEAGFTQQRADEAKAEADKKQQAEADQVTAEWASRVTEAKKDMPDFDEVITNENVEITQTMGLAILNSDQGPKLAYHLGKNPEEAARIAALNPAKQLLAMGALEHTLSLPPKVKTTTTTDPITPIKTNSNAANEKSPNDQSMDEYAASRMAQLRPARGAKA